MVGIAAFQIARTHKNDKKMEKFTDFQLSKISHTLGINIEFCINSTQKKDKYLPSKFYRNYYNYGRVSGNYKTPKWITELKDYILTWEISGLYYFEVSKKGIELFRKQFKELVTDNYRPLSRSKQRYQDYLHSECDETFGEYLGIIEPVKKWFLHGYYPHAKESSYTTETKEQLRRYESRKYNFVGNWEITDKKALESYKKELKIHRKYLRDMNLIK